MSVLANSRHELFAQHVAAGKTATEAAIAAGYAPSSARKHMSRLGANGGIRARIVEIQSQIVDRSMWSAARVLERLGEIAEAKQGDFDRPTAEWTDAMKRVGIELEPVSVRSHDGVQAGESKAWDHVGLRVKIRLSDKLKALELIGRHKAVDAFVQQQSTTELHLHLHQEVERRLTRARELAAGLEKR